VATLNRELRMPLSGVIGVSRLLEATSLDERQREYVQALRLSADALAGVIDAIVDFSALEVASIGRAPEPFDLRSAVEEVCAVGALAAAGPSVELYCYVDPQLPGVVHGDERRVRQVLMTLVGNAVKFTPQGEVVVEVALHERVEGDAVIRFRVLDTGLAIDGRGREAVPESAAEAQEAGPAGEAGLGLAVARRLVGTMGGELGVEGSSAQGNAFWFELPLHAEPVAPASPSPAGLEETHVLVVDGRPSRARLLARQLEAWGAIVAVATDRAAALAALRAGEPHDLVLAGRGLADAAALAREIAADHALVGVHTVLVATPGDPPPPGADAVVAGPIGERRMLAALAGLLGAEPSRPAGGRVLVAEDSAVNQLVAVRLLEQRGFEVDVARDGVEALSLHAENAYDAIFMDIEMPELDGYETTREIRRREGEERHTPIIAMTASTVADGLEHAIAAGMDYHMGNPIRPAGLDYIIAQAVRVPSPR